MDHAGRITIDAGAFPRLERIASAAFHDACNLGNTVELVNQMRLIEVEGNGFNGFAGILKLTGAFPQLQAIRKNAFAFVNETKACVQLASLPILMVIEEAAFYSFNGVVDV